MELEKLSGYMQAIIDSEKETRNNMETNLKAEVKELAAALKEGQEKHDQRLRKVEKYLWVGIGALGLLEVLLKLN